ncbi:bifunctional diguanylate cyclase/phosphodiesterase [Vibrio sp. VB16]|uniref:bifunctional diguanylate cyclase/phosphodiesterase n=1 Tax=Vibrio sp. VB16 TaxID=2785746 RepID=UPI0018A07655|nr:EAL domain-containing protein [Vibrio sp. VB16]UGA53649.1 EAL domain-containing protein [Vibrio sp. VB16]
MENDQHLLAQVNKLRLELTSVQDSNEQLADELGKSNQRFILAMRGANEGVWDWNIETDTVYYSPRWKYMLGYEEDELEGNLSTWKSLVHPDETKCVLEKAAHYLSGKVDKFEVEMRMRHKSGQFIYIRSSAFKVIESTGTQAVRLIGYHTDISKQKESEFFKIKHTKILEMIAKGVPAPKVYDEIALLYENKHPGMRCSMLELDGNILLHGGAPSMPKAYSDAVNGLRIGVDVGSCGASTFTGKRVLVENIETDPNWKDLKDVALPHGMRCCWSEPVMSSTNDVLGAFGMYYNHPALPDEEESADLTSAAMLTSIVMERDQNQKRMRELAYTDELTGFSSRSHLHLYLEALIETSATNNKHFALYYIDLDNFKGINDSLGHDIGDIHLQEIAERLLQLNRNIYLISRLGGDEFCILVEYIDNKTAESIAQKCLDSVSQPSLLSGRKVIQTCSIGIACFPEDGQDLKGLLKAADTALYSAKENGKNQFSFYDKSFSTKAEYKFKIEQYLREAIEKDQLYVEYQTQIDIKTGHIIGVEALARWHHPTLGQVPPYEFIEIAERIGMMKQLTEFVLNRACSQVSDWRKTGFTNIRVAVNISPTHFLDAEFVPMVRKVLSDTHIPPSSLELEVTESVVQTKDKYLSVFKQLRTLGVLMAIDDFGTGYSSFASLRHLSVDCLKIDKYFLDDYEDRKTELLIGSMIEMAHSLEYNVVAEGVEHVEQLNLLKKLGCDLAQGYLFSKPLRPEAIYELL